MIDEKVAKIKLLILDVDGVLTDGQIIINDRGEEIKSFHVRDGQGLVLLMNAGIEVIIITGRKSEAVDHRAKELGIREVYQGVKDKGGLCKKLMKQKNLERDHLCCIGDDLSTIYPGCVSRDFRLFYTINADRFLRHPCITADNPPVSKSQTR